MKSKSKVALSTKYYFDRMVKEQWQKAQDEKKHPVEIDWDKKAAEDLRHAVHLKKLIDRDRRAETADSLSPKIKKIIKNLLEDCQDKTWKYPPAKYEDLIGETTEDDILQFRNFILRTATGHRDIEKVARFEQVAGNLPMKVKAGILTWKLSQYSRALRTLKAR